MFFRLAVFATVIVLLLVMALADVAPAKTDPVEVRFRYFAWPAHSKTAQKWVDAFNKTYGPNVKLIWDGFAGTTDAERDRDITMLMAGASDVDVLLVDTPWLTEFAAKGWLLPLDGLMGNKDAFLAPFFAFSRAIGNYKSVQYGIPRSLDMSFLYYRTDVFKEKGLKAPATLQELVTAAQKTTSPQLYGLLFQGAKYEGLVCAWIEILHAFGGNVLGESQTDPSGGVTGQRTCNLESEAAARATQFVYDLVYTHRVTPPGVITYTEAEVRKFFTAGGAAMAREWMDMVVEFNDPAVSKAAGKVGVAPLPAGPAGSFSCVGGWVFAINKFTKHPKEAWTALQFLTSAEALKVGLLTDGITPPRQDVYEDPEMKAHPLWGQVAPTMIEVAKAGIPRPLSPIWPQQSDVIQQAIHRVFAGELTAAAAMKWADEEVQEIENAYVAK